MKTFLLSLVMVILCISAKAQTSINPTYLPAAAISCTCNPAGWRNFSAYVDDVQSTIKCGDKLFPKKGQSVKLSSGYKCVGGCTPKYIFILKKADGTIIENTSSEGSSTMSWGYLFSEMGIYYLEITPICNGKKCATCTIYFTML